jgi:hypothetical protein
MKTKDRISFFIIILFSVFFIIACYNPAGSGGSATISINLSGEAARVATGFNGKVDTDVLTLTYRVELGTENDGKPIDVPSNGYSAQLVQVFRA